jgi:hypothetical protein
VVAQATVLAWNVLVIGSATAWAVVSATDDPDWGGLVALVVTFVGMVAFCLSLTTGALVMAMLTRRPRWRERAAAGWGVAIGSGTAAAGVGGLVALGVTPLVLWRLGS